MFSKYRFGDKIMKKFWCKVLRYFFWLFFAWCWFFDWRLCLINVLVARYPSDSCLKAKSCLTEGEHSDINKGNLPYLMSINFCRIALNFFVLSFFLLLSKQFILREDSNLTFLEHPQILTNLVILHLVSFFTYCPRLIRFLVSWDARWTYPIILFC